MVMEDDLTSGGGHTVQCIIEMHTGNLHNFTNVTPINVIKMKGIF